MSESESDEFLSAEEDSLPPYSNSTHSTHRPLLADRHCEQLEKPAYHNPETTQHNVGDIVDTLIEKDNAQVADHSANKLDIPTESCQLDNQSNTDSIVQKLCSTPVQPELQQTETPIEDVRSVFDPIQLEAVRTEVLARKETGNCLYREQDFSSARDSYSSALELCPRELSTERAFLFSNRSLCLLKLEEHQLALADCSQALLIDPQFTKAKIRRAQLYEKVHKLEDALSDYSEVLTADPSCPQAREAVPRLTAEVEVQREVLKTEALSKLRDLGDMVLKPFGFSTNDFNFVQDPNTGNYSVSFGKNS